MESTLARSRWKAFAHTDHRKFSIQWCYSCLENYSLKTNSMLQIQIKSRKTFTCVVWGSWCVREQKQAFKQLRSLAMMNYTTDDLGKDQKLTPKQRLRLVVQKKVIFFFSPLLGIKQWILSLTTENWLLESSLCHLQDTVPTWLNKKYYTCPTSRMTLIS